MIEEIVEVARAVQYEMSYLNHVSKSDVLSESSFKYPAVEWLERKGGKEKVFFEKAHLLFKYRKTDISWKDGNIQNVIEMKYVKADTADKTEQQRYFNDLLRLAHIIIEDSHANAYFLACGQTEYWKPCFQNFGMEAPTGVVPIISYDDEKKREKTTVNGVYSQWFSFDNSDPTRVIDTNSFSEFYGQFVSDYKFKMSTKNHPDRMVIKTELLWISEVDSMQNPCATAVWRITL